MTSPAVQHDPALMWIYGIFSACQVRYGRRFLAQYDGVAIELVHRDWARVLREYACNPAAIKWALENLPDAPVLAPQFRQLCGAAPRPATRQLERPAVSPARLSKVREQLQQIVSHRVPTDSKGWAREVLARADRGEAVSYRAKQMALEVLGKAVRV